MVVDDDRRMRRKLERLLIDSGYRVIKAESGEMLLEAIGRTPLDLIIMEAHLPGHTGLETLAKLREDNHRLPVIIWMIVNSAAPLNITSMIVPNLDLRASNIPPMISPTWR